MKPLLELRALCTVAVIYDGQDGIRPMGFAEGRFRLMK
jgi:hypothetical protein